MSELLTRWLDFDESQPLLVAVIAWIVRAAVVVGAAWIISRLASRWSSDFVRGVWICAFFSLAIVAVQAATRYPLKFQLPVVAEVPPSEASDSVGRPETIDRAWAMPSALPGAKTVVPAEALPMIDVPPAASRRRSRDRRGRIVRGCAESESRLVVCCRFVGALHSRWTRLACENRGQSGAVETSCE